MDILNSLNQALYPGHRVIRVKGYKAAKDYPMPRDSEAIFLDDDPAVNYIYMKKVDVNGGEMIARYLYEEDPIPEFDPKKYVTTEEFNNRMEEVINGINSIRESISTTTTNRK